MNSNFKPLVNQYQTIKDQDVLESINLYNDVIEKREIRNKFDKDKSGDPYFINLQIQKAERERYSKVKEIRRSFKEVK